MLAKLWIALSMTTGTLLIPGAANAQTVFHAFCGKITTSDPTRGTISMVSTDGVSQSFTTSHKTNASSELDGRMRITTVAPSAYSKTDQQVVLYYSGYGLARTAVAIQDLGPGPFSVVEGMVKSFDKHSHTLQLQSASGEMHSIELADNAVADTPSGIRDENHFEPRKGAQVRITASTAAGKEQAVFVRAR